MDYSEAIAHQAMVNARGGRPMREEEVCKEMPYIQIYQDTLGKLQVMSYNYENHDNAPRMQLYETYLNNNILPNVTTSDVCGWYNIELHDSYTYLNRSEAYRTKGILTFSKYKDDTSPVLLPDPYMVSNWGGMLTSIRDDTPWDAKQDAACFFGTTTGDRNPIRNQRIRFCMSCLDNPVLTCKITHIAQMSEQDIVRVYDPTQWSKTYAPSVISPIMQMQYKFLISLDGNTCRFDVWNYATNCVTMKAKSREMLWYYPMLLDGQHFIGFDLDNLDDLANKVRYFAKEQKLCTHINKNAQMFAQEMFRPLSHIKYTTQLFESMSENRH